MQCIKVIRQREKVYILSNFSDKHNVLVFVAKGTNKQISYCKAELVDKNLSLKEALTKGGIVFHKNGDDATPWNINGTYIGGNHGCSDGLEIELPDHNLTTKDLGSEWLDARGNSFYLIRVKDKNQIRCLSENNGKNGIWSFRINIAGNTLKRKTNSREIKFQKPERIQITPACRINKQEYLLDGEKPLPENEVHTCNFLDIVENYDIIAPDSLLDAYKNNPGKDIDRTAKNLDAVINSNIRYRFLPNATCVEKHDCITRRPVKLGYMGFIQSTELFKGDFTIHDYYMPQSKAFKNNGRAYNFSTIEDFSEKMPNYLPFGSQQKNIENPEILPDRFIQFLGNTADGKKKYELGYALGYSLVEGCTIPEIRKENTDSALFIYTSNKTYPAAINKKLGILPEGQKFSCTAYRQYFNPKAFSKKATACYWHVENGVIMLYAHYHNTNEDTLKLPASWAGKNIETIENHSGITVKPEKILEKFQLKLSKIPEHSYIVIKVFIFNQVFRLYFQKETRWVPMRSMIKFSKLLMLF